VFNYAATKARRRDKGRGTKSDKREAKLVNVMPDASDAWRLGEVVSMLTDGCVGIIPTDSSPALVCDLENKDAVELLYSLKRAAPSKQMSILCRNFADVSKYTLGFPVSNAPGKPDFFRIARQILPGPYTLILQASKQLPKQITNYESGRSKHRLTVGVRLPDDAVCQAILQQLDRPLLCSSVVQAAIENEVSDDIVESAVLADIYGPQGLGFVVDVGPRPADISTVIDLSGHEPVLVRKGKGEVSFLDTL
jgi:tRNA threonylcarbamoyl adenosine modification protein (Sua5/YciO/YrdC/YwlC family)